MQLNRFGMSDCWLHDVGCVQMLSKWGTFGGPQFYRLEWMSIWSESITHTIHCWWVINACTRQPRTLEAIGIACMELHLPFSLILFIFIIFKSSPVADKESSSLQNWFNLFIRIFCLSPCCYTHALYQSHSLDVVCSRKKPIEPQSLINFVEITFNALSHRIIYNCISIT